MWISDTCGVNLNIFKFNLPRETVGFISEMTFLPTYNNKLISSP
jgi:hypothetical protein